MEKLKVKKVIISKQGETSENYEKFLEIAKQNNIKILMVKSGDKIKIEKDIYFDILFPEEKQIQENMLNNNSVVAKLVYKKFSLLFTGDIEEIAEKRILEKYKNSDILKSTVLKVAHHGSKSSSIQEFLNAVSPRIALIGVGKNNKFGHPSDTTIHALNAINCNIYRTDENGEITIIINENSIKFPKSVNTKIKMLLGIGLGMILFKNETNKISEKNIVENKVEEISEIVTDECTEEWEEMQEQTKAEIETNAIEERISPNCIITLKIYYKSCAHTLIEYNKVPEELVNKTQKELEQKYYNWKVEKYSSTEIVLSNAYEGNCGEHYILKEKDGKIAIYKIEQNNKETLYKETEIAIDYLTETDKIEIKNGIRVNGKQNLNQLIEDFS